MRTRCNIIATLFYISDRKGYPSANVDECFRHINKVGELAFDASRQKRQGIPLRRVKESVIGIEAQAKTIGVQKIVESVFDVALFATCHIWTRESNRDRA